MANPKIRAKRSSVEGKVPSTTQLERGEFAVNTYDGKVYVLKDQYSVGIATTTVNVNPWAEPNGIGAGVSYSGSVTATSFAGDGSALTNLNVAGVATFSGNYNHLFNKPTIPTNNNQLTNGAGYITNDVSGNLNLGDNERLRLGAPDFEIYHDGSNSYINNYTGRLRIQTPGPHGVHFRKNVSELIATFEPDGAVSLYYDAVKKFETSSTGVDVTGNITVSGTVDGVDVAALSSTVAGIDTSGFSSGTIPTNNNQLTNGAGYITASSVPTNNNQLTNGQGFITGYTVTSSDVTQHEGDITITESQISDLGTYLTSSDLSSYATQSYVNTQVSNLVDSAPGTLDTLNELAAALGDDANFSTTVTDSIATKMPLAGGTFTGAVTFASGQTFDYNNLTNTPTIPSNNNQLTNGAGYITNSVSGDLTLTDTATDNSAGPEFVLYRNSSSPSSADYIGQIKFQGESTSGATRLYAKITGKIGDPTNGSEDGIIEIAHRKNGSNNISGRWNQDELQLLNGTELSLGDSQKIKVGTGDDLEIYHDSVNSQIVSSTGDLYVQSDGDDLILQAVDNIFIRPQNGEEGIRVHGNGSTELYYDNNRKLETTSGGIDVNGTINATSFSGDGSSLTGVTASNADTVDNLHASQFLRSDTDDDAQGFGSRANVNSTGDPGLFILDGSRLGFDQTGTRSWTFKASGGNLNVTSGDGNGYLTGQINASTLDSIDSSQFLRSDANDTATGSITFTNDNGIYIKPTTNGTGAKIHFSDHASGSYAQNGTIQYKHADASVTTTGGNSNDGWIVSGSETRTVFKVEGDIEATSDIYSSSDISLKDNVVTYENALDKVLAMRGVEYDRNDLDGKHEVGLIAQEVEEIIPELVGEHHGLKNIAYGKLTAVLIEAIKEQQQQINDLRQQLNKGK